ncbi:MAG: hypothetical protein Q9192_004901 [Flavoplaca navasiana]
MQLVYCARTLRPLIRCLRYPSSRCYATSFSQSPAPPRLPKEEQELYEKLQASSTGAFSTPRPTVVVNQTASPDASARPRPQINQSPHSAPQPQDTQPGTSNAVNARVQATGKGEELHPDVRRGAKPDFEGETNPQTGEVGGPKNEPLRWGGGVDWSYNGRVTDF